MTTASHFSLLVVDDEPDLRTLYELTLLREGYDLDTAGTVQEALLHLKDRTYSAVITDMRLPDGSGLDVLRWLEESNRREKAIVITAYGSSENAVEALKAGAYDYLTKPVDLKQFRGVVASALGRGGGGAPTVDPATLPSEHRRPRRRRARRARRRRRAAPTPVSAALGRMAGQSMAMQQVRSLVEKVARSMAPVLVTGESGTGKELVARAIHEVSVRSAKPFVPVNCSAIPEQLLEAEFFGYRKGAFTGADDDREGFFQAANGGTLVPRRDRRPAAVDAVEAAALDPGAVGAAGRRGHRSAGRRASAQRDAQGPRRRSPGRPVPPGPLLPPQRHPDPRAAAARAPRGPDGDQRALVLERLARDAGVWPAPRLTRDALVHLSRYPFPGNVRELENLLHRAVALSGARGARRLRPRPARVGVHRQRGAGARPDRRGRRERRASRRRHAARMAPVEEPLPNDLAKYLDDVERDILVRALEHHRFNRTAAGISLGLSLRQMRYRMARLNVNVGGDSGGADRE